MYLYVLKTHELFEYTEYSKLIKFSNTKPSCISFFIKNFTCDELFSFIFYLKTNQIPYFLNDYGYIHMLEGFNAKGDYEKLNLKVVNCTNWFNKQLELYQNYKLY